MNKILTSVFIFSLSCIVIINFVLANTSEFWKYGYETGVVVNGLSMSFVAAYIFYILDIVLPKKEKEKLISARIINPAILIVRDIENLFEDLIFLAEKRIVVLSDETLSKEYLREIISTINLMETRIPFKLNSSLKEVTVFESMQMLKKRVDSHSKQIKLFYEIDLNLLLCVQKTEVTPLWSLINQLEQTFTLRPEIKRAIESSLFLESLYELQLNKEELKTLLFKRIDIAKQTYEGILVEDERIIELRKKFNIKG